MTMICGACPGWICYAEKTQPEVLPLISTTKSAQQILGYWIKTYFAESVNIPPADLYHVSVMPCYDKKLEASRESTFIEGNKLREVDCVLASMEILQLITDHNIDFESLPESPLNVKYHNLDEFGQLWGNRGGTSGGYLEFILRFAAKSLWNRDIDNIQYTSIRTDYSEVIIEQNGFTLKFARANGFRSIQNIVRRFKQNKCDYDFIEVMACPGGCTNGGGQIRTDSNNPTEVKKLLSRVTDIYNQRISKWPTETVNLYQLLAIDTKNLHTSYKAVPKKELANPLSIKW